MLWEDAVNVLHRGRRLNLSRDAFRARLAGKRWYLTIRCKGPSLTPEYGFELRRVFEIEEHH